MPRYLLSHRHAESECPVVFAAWKGFDSPLRQRPTLSTCHEGGHRLWWTVDAFDETEARRLLPPYLADRTEVIAVSEVMIP